MTAETPVSPLKNVLHTKPGRGWKLPACLFAIATGIAVTLWQFGWIDLHSLKVVGGNVEPPAIPDSGMNPAVRITLERARDRVIRQPDSSRAWGSLGMNLMQHELPQEALLCFERAILLDPADARWSYYSAVILEQKDLHRSLEHFEAAIRKDALYVPARSRYASALITAGRFDSAMTQLQKVRAGEPSNPSLYLQLMRTEKLQNRPDAGLRWLTVAREQSAVSRGVLEEAARLELLAGHKAEADQLLEESRLQPPDRPVSDSWYEAIAALDVSGSVASAKADELRQRGQLREAATALKTLANRFPERSRPALNHALALRDQGLPEEAIRELVSLRSRFSGDPIIRYHLAVTLATTGRNTEAITELEACLQLKPDYGLARAVYGDLLHAEGNQEEAIRQARTAVDLSPGDAWIRLGLISLLQRCSRTEEARKELSVAKTIIQPSQEAERSALSQLESSLAPASPESPGNFP